MCQRPADRAAIADLRIRDRPGHPGDDPQIWGVLERGVRGQRPDPPGAVLALDPVQPGDLAQVHEQRRRRQAELHQRQQRMSAGQQLGVLATVGDRLDRLLERVRRGVVELGRNHAGTPPLAS